MLEMIKFVKNEKNKRNCKGRITIIINVKNKIKIFHLRTIMIKIIK